MYKTYIRVLENKQQVKAALKEVGADPGGIAAMLPKGLLLVVSLRDVPIRGAIILKEEMLALGAEAAVSRGVGDLSVEKTDMLLLGTTKQFNRLLKALKPQTFFGLSGIREELSETIQAWSRKPLPVTLPGGGILPLGERTLVMGILNVTPDSFSDGGLFDSADDATEHAVQMEEAGADIIDVGGESTRPGYTPVSPEDEMKRVLPVIEKIAARVKVPISIDSYKASVAKAALQAGAQIINDVWGCKADPGMAEVAADSGAPICVMHNRNNTNYQNLISDIIEELRESIEICRSSGVKNEQIIIDPGIGFGKTSSQNLEVVRRLKEFKSLGYPLLLGTSRKSFIGKALNLPPTERIEGTAASIALGIARGADIVRVHDVKEMIRVVKAADAILADKGDSGNNE